MTALAQTLVTVGIVRGVVEAPDEASAPGFVRVATAGGRRVAARVLAGVPTPLTGDEALLATTMEGEAFVVGVVSAAPRVAQLSTADGTTATIERHDGVDVLRVRDPRGHLVLEHRAGRAVLTVPEGDLELSAPAGRIRIQGRDGVDIHSPREVKVESPSLLADVSRAELKTRDARLNTETLAVVAARAHHTIGALEIRAGKIIQRARDVFLDVEEHFQTRAGRIRTVAQETFHLMAKRTLLKAKEDVKVKAEKIYLG